ncbi:MAG: two-component regulator propeller domain-containing protein, partial [Bacteroidota bacterium]
MTTTAASGRFWLLICLGLVCNLNVAQPTRYFFDHLTTEEGLSQNDVNCILQDQTGFMWFGTNDGLNLYDGYEFTIFKPREGDSTSIISNLIQVLAEDTLGRIWIGTAGEGLSCYLPRYNRFINLKDHPEHFPEFPSDFIVSLHIDSSQRLWVGTSKGLRLLELSGEYEIAAHSIQDISQQVLPKKLRNERIGDVFEDNPREYWVGGNSGLYHLRMQNPAQPRFQSFRVRRMPARGINKGKYGELLVSMGQSLFRVTSPQYGTYSVKNLDKQTHDALLMLDGNLWTSSMLGLSKFSYPHGRTRLKKEKVYTSDLSDLHSLNKSVLRTIYADRNGIIWIGTNGGGINKFEPRQKTFAHYKQTLNEGSISYDKIRALYEDSQQNLWIGTEGGGLNLLSARDSGAHLYNNFTHLSYPRNVFAISEYTCDSKRYLLMGGQFGRGLHSIPLEENMRSLEEVTPIPIPEINSSVFSLLNVDDCDIWVGTYHNGLYRLDTRTRKVEGPFMHEPDVSQSLSSDLVRSLMRDTEGNIWIGTGNGLNRMTVADQESDTPEFTRYLHDVSDSMSISHDYILALFQSKSGDIWIGTFGGGLNKYVPASDEHAAHFISFSEEDGLPNNVVKGILEDDEGFLWLSTNKGLTRFNPDTEVFYNFDTKDGLQSNEFSELAQLKRRNGDMLFGGVNGFNVFQASSINLNPNPPQVALTDFQVLNQPVQVGDKF